ncbi:MAG: LPP20 family lipoprotein [Melioribacteraceae bacterium]|nr:LPP20 family lipoprotein [Melioribacteraceae bacterium]
MINFLQLILVITFICSGNLIRAQEYPDWFLNQQLVPGKSVAGYSRIYKITESSYDEAYQNARHKSAMFGSAIIKGGQGFLKSERGQFWMGSDIKIEYDTSQVVKFALSAVDTVFTNGMCIILYSDSTVNGEFESEKLSPVLPDWISNLPSNRKFVYSVGTAPRYYYEVNSWLEAEKNALINLARNSRINISSLSYQNRKTQQSVKKEELKITLRGIEILERHYDSSSKIFYVLIRTSNDH